MAVVGDIPVAVVDLHQIAVAAHPAGVDHRTAVGGVDRRAVAVGDVDGLVVGAGAADTGVAPSEIGRDDAVAGPAEAAGGIPGGTLLGAAELLLRHRLGQGDAGHDLPLSLRTVDIGDVGGDVRLAVDAGGRDLILALIHGGVVGVLHRIGYILHIALPLHIYHRQVGHGVADGQHVAHPQDLGVVARVHLHQRVHGDAVFAGDAVIAVAALDGVGDLALPGGVEDLGDIAQIHNIGRVHVLLSDLHILHEVGVHRVLRLIAQLQLGQNVIQRAGERGGYHLFPVHIQNIGVLHQTQLVSQLIPEVLLRRDLLTQEHAGLGLQQGLIHLVAAVLQRLAGNALHLRDRQRHRLPGGDDAQILAVVDGAGADGVQGEDGRGGGDAHGRGQKDRRVQLDLLKEAALPVANADQALAALAQALPEVGTQTGQAVPEEQKQLRRAVF